MSSGRYGHPVLFLPWVDLKTVPGVWQAIVLQQVNGGVQCHDLSPQGQSDVQSIHIQHSADPVQGLLRTVP